MRGGLVCHDGGDRGDGHAAAEIQVRGWGSAAMGSGAFATIYFFQLWIMLVCCKSVLFCKLFVSCKSSVC